MNILMLQHASVEGPGRFEGYLTEDGHTFDVVHMDQGEVPPPLDGYDALWVLGGPMDVWQEDAHPWLAGEKIPDQGRGRGAGHAVSRPLSRSSVAGRGAGR